MREPRPDRKPISGPRPPAEEGNSIDRSLFALVTTGCCFRCKGLLVPYTAVKKEGEYWNECGPAFRCVNCGEIVDPLILHNRSFGFAASPTHPRR